MDQRPPSNHGAETTIRINNLYIGFIGMPCEQKLCGYCAHTIKTPMRI